MSTSPLPHPAVLAQAPIGEPLDIRQLITVLIKHYGVHEGLYDLFLEYRMGFGLSGPSPSDLLPSAMVGLARLSITRVAQLGPLTVDASKVNPRAKRARRRSKLPE